MTELERALVALGSELDFPPTPDLAAGVRPRLQRRRRWLRPALVVAAIAVLAVGIAFAVPPARSAILRFLHLGSATVVRVETLPPAQERPLAAGLGPLRTRADAEALAQVRMRLPHGTAPSDYYAQPGLIATLLRVHGTPVLVAEMRGDQMFVVKKFVSPGTHMEQVDIGEWGVLLQGGPHVLMWQSGHVETRLAGNVLLWVDHGTTYRLEGALDKRQMLDLAHQITR
jgi:hypothetical protein